MRIRLPPSKRLRLLSLQCALLYVAFASSELQQTHYVIVVIGDSFSATDNVYEGAPYPNPNDYYQGRFTNGPNWVDAIKAAAWHTKLTVLNYASGAGTACQSPWVESTLPKYRNLTSQTAAFIADVQSGNVTLGPNVKLVVLQAIGTMDFLASAWSPIATVDEINRDILARMQSMIAAVVSCRMKAIHALLQVSASLDVVLLPLQPMQLLPFVRLRQKEMFKTFDQVMGTQMASAISRMQALLDEKSSAGASTIKLHAFGNTSDWITAGVQEVQPGFKQLQKPCLADHKLHICASANSYLWYDKLHMSTRFHRWLGTKGVLPRLQDKNLLPIRF